MSRLISLASGVLPEFTPLETVAAAAAAGWPAVGLTIDPAQWTARIASDIRSRVADAGLVVLDVEVLWLHPGPDDPGHVRILDAGAAIGARNALIVSSDAPGPTAEKLVRLAEHAAARDMRVSLEFAAFTAIHSLAAARDIVELTGRDDIGLLIDALHLARTGGVPDDLRAVDPGRFAYAQLCDAPAHGPAPEDVGAIIAEALDDRLDVGAGGLPLEALLAILPPALPLSIELRSRALRDTWPDAADRARALLSSTRSGLAGA